MFKTKNCINVQVNGGDICQVAIYRVSNFIINETEIAKPSDLYKQDWFLFEPHQPFSCNMQLLQKIAEWFVINTPLCYKATAILDGCCKASYIESDKLPVY